MFAVIAYSLGLDIALGLGGLPRGRVVEIYGPESSGKTTSPCRSSPRCRNRRHAPSSTPSTRSTPDYAEKLGVNLDDLLISQPDTGEQALEIADMLVRSGGVDIVVIDSVAALTPKAEIEGEMGDQPRRPAGRLMSQALRKITANIKRTNTLVIFINQIRMKIGVMFGSPETTTGGNALKFYASVRLDIRRTGTIKKGDEVTTRASSCATTRRWPARSRTRCGSRSACPSCRPAALPPRRPRPERGRRRWASRACANARSAISPGATTPAPSWRASSRPTAKRPRSKAVIERMRELGLQSDARYAETFVRGKAARFGTARLRQELAVRRHRPTGSTRRSPAECVESEIRARAVLRGHFCHPPADAREWARQAHFLQTRGFAPELIRKLLKEPRTMSLPKSPACKKRYKARTVVHDVGFEVGSGEVVGLLGPNGAGKTTCFYMIVGLVRADGGRSPRRTATSPTCPSTPARASACPTCPRDERVPQAHGGREHPRRARAAGLPDEAARSPNKRSRNC